MLKSSFQSMGKYLSRLIFVGLCLPAFSAWGQASNPNPSHSTTGAAASQEDPSAASYRLKCQDVLAITFPLTAEYNETVTVLPDGFISLQLVKGARVADLTVEQATTVVREAYAGVLHDPLVSIEVKNFQLPFFTVLGQVGKPGKYDLRQKTLLTEGIAIAGGFTPTAKTQVVLIRPVAGETAEIFPYQISDFLKVGANPPEPVELRSGDMIFVPEKFISKFKKYVNYGSIGGLSAASLY
jgi:polysaccharide export outer membrane protein